MDAPALILARLLQSSGEFAEAGAVVHRTEGIPITLIGFLRNFSAPVHVGHAAPHSAPLQVVLRAAFCGPVGFEHFYVLGEGLDAKQVAHGSAGFAVTLQGIAVDTVFDPVPAGAAFEIGRQFPRVVAGNLSGNVDSVTQKLQHIRTGKTEHPVFEQQRRQACERARAKEDIGGPLALKAAPVILCRVVAEDLLVQRVQTLRQRLQPLGPVDLQLFLEKLLRARNVLDPGKAVLLADIAEPLSVHASRQPFPAIDADVHVKREPGLNPRMHPAKFRIDAVMINRQTGTGPDHHVRFVVLECGSHLHTAQSAHIPFGNASFGSEGARDLLFVVLAVDVLHQQILLLKRRQCRLLDLLTDLLHMIFVLLAEDVVLRQVPLHSQRMGEASQTTAKQHPVKAGHHTLDILLEFGDKLLHGVSPWFSVADLIHPTTYIIRGTPNTVCGLPLCGADLQVCAGSSRARASRNGIGNIRARRGRRGRRPQDWSPAPRWYSRAFPATSPATRAGDSSHLSREWRQARLRAFLAGQGAGWEWSARPPARIPTV